MFTARAPAALDPATAPVDGKSARERLAFAAQFARLVRFYGLDNRADGNWEAFLLKDAAILLATIGSTDYHDLHAQYEALTRTGNLPAGARRALVPALFGLLQHMMARLAHWHQCLDRQGPAFPLRAFLARAVREQLAPDLARMRHLHETLARGKLADWPDIEWYRGLGPAWHVSPGLPPAAPQPGDENEAQALAAAVTQLRQLYLATLDVMIQTVDAAAGEYERVACQPTPHADTALLRVFVELMRHQQAALNGIGRRHLDFYYGRVLDMDKRGAEPDHVTVLLTVASGNGSVTIPAGTRFSAGTDASGAPLWYASAEPAVVNSARILAAFSLGAQAGAMAAGPARGVHWERLADTETLQFGQDGQLADQVLFGAPAGTAQGLGFALGSPMLLLEGGSRTITLTLELAAGAPPLPPDWEHGWQCWLSGDKGWFDASAYALPPHWQEADGGQPARLLLELMLPADAPPVVAPATPLDGNGCPWPQVKYALPPASAAHPWPGLGAVRIDARVRDLAALQLWNGFGPLAGPAVSPFGPVPQAGSRFYVGSREIFAKPVDRLGVSLAWANLPPGIGAWYREYNAWQEAERPGWIAFTDTVHEAAWQYLRPDGWQAAAVTVPLGRAADSLFQGGNRSVYSLRPGAGFRPDPRLALAALPAPHEAHAGYLALTLQHPPQAFGHQQYAQVLMWASQQHAARTMRLGPATREGLPGMPNAPFTPVLGAITAEYSASCRIVPGADAGDDAPACPGEWLHYGLGHAWAAWRSGAALPARAPLAPGMPGDGLTLVPRVAATGAVLLALAALPAPCSLRLFAGVTDDGGGAGVDAWLYGNDGWTALAVRRDGTDGLSDSGILELQVTGTPAPLPFAGEPAADAWLALTPRNAGRAPRLAMLATQAVSLRRQDLAPDCMSVAPLAPGSIAKAPLAALASVRQPLPSHGGRAAETRDRFEAADSYHGRVSRHLLHKGRAVTPRDFVLLAHRARPGLYRVDVLDAAAQGRGDVDVCVIARSASASAAGAFLPRLSPGERQELATFLQARASSAARVTVRNPRAHEVHIAARLVLAPDAQAAWPSLRPEWNHALRVYLSPWIDSDKPQYAMGDGLTRAGLLRRLASFPGVLAIERLLVTTADTDGQPRTAEQEELALPPGGLWVSARQHDLSLAGG